jgi:glutamine synthetase
MAENLMKIMKDEDVQYVDLRFTDPRGKMQHVSFHKDMVDADFFVDGQMFDGSSDRRLEAINESDMLLKPGYRTVGTWTRSSQQSTHGDLLRHPRSDHRRRRTTATRA